MKLLQQVFFRLELRASEAIKKDQEVVNQYVKPNSGTVSRRLVLKNKWHFECDCRRCRDPTEFGSYLSALTCSKSKVILNTISLVIIKYFFITFNQSYNQAIIF